MRWISDALSFDFNLAHWNDFSETNCKSNGELEKKKKPIKLFDKKWIGIQNLLVISDKHDG